MNQYQQQAMRTAKMLPHRDNLIHFALVRAEEMRKARIASLRKSIEKMERLTLTAPNVEFSGQAAALSPRSSAGTQG